MFRVRAVHVSAAIADAGATCGWCRRPSRIPRATTTVAHACAVGPKGEYSWVGAVHQSVARTRRDGDRGGGTGSSDPGGCAAAPYSVKNQRWVGIRAAAGGREEYPIVRIIVGIWTRGKS